MQQGQATQLARFPFSFSLFSLPLNPCENPLTQILSIPPLQNNNPGRWLHHSHYKSVKRSNETAWRSFLFPLVQKSSIKSQVEIRPRQNRGRFHLQGRKRSTGNLCYFPALALHIRWNPQDIAALFFRTIWVPCPSLDSLIPRSPLLLDGNEPQPDVVGYPVAVLVAQNGLEQRTSLFHHSVS